MDQRLNAQLRQQVLYVEDNPVNVMLMQAVFELRPGLSLSVATCSAEALEIGAGLQPSLLLLDIRLPDLPGTDLLPLLRQRLGWIHVPAVAVTAEPDFVLEDSGFIEIWRKPLSVHAMLERLDGWLAPETGYIRFGTPPLPYRQGLRAA